MPGKEHLFGKNMFEAAFTRNEKLHHDILNFWPVTNKNYLEKLSPEELRKYFDSLELMPHYQQGYEEINKKETARIMKLSDPEQVAKYDHLVDDYNKNLERTKQEQDQKQDIETFLAYIKEVNKLKNEKK